VEVTRTTAVASAASSTPMSVSFGARRTTSTICSAGKLPRSPRTSDSNSSRFFVTRTSGFGATPKRCSRRTAPSARCCSRSGFGTTGRSPRTRPQSTGASRRPGRRRVRASRTTTTRSTRCSRSPRRRPMTTTRVPLPIATTIFPSDAMPASIGPSERSLDLSVHIQGRRCFVPVRLFALPLPADSSHTRRN
jgi:hypothetical protein